MTCNSYERGETEKQSEDGCSHPASTQRFEVTTTLGDKPDFCFTRKHLTVQNWGENMCLNVVGEIMKPVVCGFGGFLQFF